MIQSFKRSLRKSHVNLVGRQLIGFQDASHGTFWDLERKGNESKCSTACLHKWSQQNNSSLLKLREDLDSSEGPLKPHERHLQGFGECKWVNVSLFRSFSTMKHSGSPPKQEQKREGVHPLWNWPNGISTARLVTGPIIGYLILEHHWQLAFACLTISGISDWLDGFVARKFNQGSVIGSYLDPLADKVLICCTTGALALEGSLYAPLAYLIIGRDAFLVSGAFFLRFRALNWKWPGYSEFFRTIDARASQSDPHSFPISAETRKTNDTLEKSRGSTSKQTDPAPFVTPLYISKVNTVAQLGLIAGCITSSWYHWPDENVLLYLGGFTALLTLASGIEYYRTQRDK